MEVEGCGRGEWSQSPGPAAAPATLCIHLWLSLSGAVHTLPLPFFVLGALDQARNRPARRVVILQGPHGPSALGAPKVGHLSDTLDIGQQLGP